MFLHELVYALKEEPAKQVRESGLVSLMGACFSNMDKSESQNYQDVWALWSNDFMKYGYFVEFGATDGVTGSNTLLLEREYDWIGIVAEPNPVWHQNLINNRNCITETRCVYTETGSTIEFLAADDPALSTIKGFGDDDQFKQARSTAKTISVETITLYDMLEYYRAPDQIDYLSIDTEGTELEILQKFFDQNDKYKIKCVTVEHNFTPAREKIFDMMTKNGYERVFPEISRWDDFYLLKGN